jgi:hypothetical protein
MRVAFSVLFLLLPVVAFAQVKRTNPPALSAPTGYTHIVEVTGPARHGSGEGRVVVGTDQGECVECRCPAEAASRLCARRRQLRGRDKHRESRARVRRQVHD